MEFNMECKLSLQTAIIELDSWKEDLQNFIKRLDKYYTSSESLSILGLDDREDYESWLDYKFHEEDGKPNTTQEACECILTDLQDLIMDMYRCPTKFELDRITEEVMHVSFAW